jgi:hypothetical protein
MIGETRLNLLERSGVAAGGILHRTGGKDRRSQHDDSERENSAQHDVSSDWRD